MNNYLTRKQASEKLGIHFETLYKIAERKEIETIKIGKQTLYNIDKYLKEKGVGKENKRKICYCRVSSAKQKEDLKRQIEMMRQMFPLYEIISDIGSGLNFNRKGLLEIIDSAINGEIEEIIIAYKDRLARFGYDRTYNNQIFERKNKKEEETPLDEVTKDIVSIMNIYTAKINGLRKYKKIMTDEINGKIENV